jgi:hypothetical protein
MSNDLKRFKELLIEINTLVTYTEIDEKNHYDELKILWDNFSEDEQYEIKIWVSKMF